MAKTLIDYSVSGDGPAVILLHGLNASRFDWVWLSHDLNKAGFRTYMPDLLGHGESAKPTDTALYTLTTQFAVILDWIESLPEDIPLCMIGHSMGGYLALKLALKMPERIQALTLIDPYFSQSQLSPFIRMVNRFPHLSEYAVRTAPGWLINSLIGLDPWTTNNFPPQVRDQIANDYKRTAPQAMYFVPSAIDLSSQIYKIQQPTLLIWGDRDLTLLPSSFEKMQSTIPQCIGYQVSNCGHQPHISRPDEVNPLVVDFFTRQHSGLTIE